MRIAFVSQLYWPHRGGVEKYVEEIATRLAREHEISVLTADPTGTLPFSEDIKGVHVRRFNSWAPNESIYHSLDMWRYLRRHSDSFDIVHANNYHALPAYYAAVSKNHNKLVFTPHFHGTIGHSTIRKLLHIPYKALGGRIFAEADKVICCTDFERKMIQRSFRVPNTKLVMIKEGINQVGHRVERPEELHRIIICVARLEKYKGIQYIIRALHHLPTYTLIVVGSGPYGPTLQSLVRTQGLQDRVVFRSNLTEEELGAVYREADVAVLLSAHEQYSYFVGEALAAGIPCVVANRDALKEWVDGESCLGVYDPADSSSVAEAILSMTGRKVNRKLPTWDDYVTRLTELYREALD